MLLRIQHETRRTYSLPVSETVFEVRMAPPSDDDQTALSYRLRITPQAQVTSYRDGNGNRVDLFNISASYKELVVQTTSFVRTHRRPALDRLALAQVVWPSEGLVSIDAMEFLHPSPLVPDCDELREFVASLNPPAGPLGPLLLYLMEAVNGRLKYEKSVTKARTHVGEALSLGSGVCQDYSHLFIGACRGLGIPARYVSGYWNHPGEIATHAWAQVWGGEMVGWIDVDPTHNTIVSDDHVTTAVGRDYTDVPPNRGLWKGRSEEVIAVTVKVEPVDRVPLEWNDWNAPVFRQGERSSAAGGNRANGRIDRRSRAAYPNQPNPRSVLMQQQGEQQQQSPLK